MLGSVLLHVHIFGDKLSGLLNLSTGEKPTGGGGGGGGFFFKNGGGGGGGGRFRKNYPKVLTVYRNEILCFLHLK